MPPQLAIVVPVYNEQDNVLPLRQEIAAALARETGTWEVVFVDDGSTDATWTRIREARQIDRRVRGLRHQHNAGQSAAVWTGIQNTSSPLLATLDGDRQNDPAELPRLLELLREFDFVCGRRAHRQDTRLRRVSSAVARWARTRALGYDFRDTGCALRVFRREALAGVPGFNGLHRFLPILVAGGGFRTLEVPVSHRPRVAGVSKYGVWNRLGRGLYDLIGVAWFQKRRLRPVPVERLDGEVKSEE
jgi:dolichol-phosphate mannosyltransferase